ncbi:unnamed protein product [Triticum turgidum subsp. durum]|uniref:Uncharacterized protein n=1 Tax=Triticum turgidum subsp. durum TaxID=4567 RepID=A0A9R1PIX4_TRITD|nr:unnamed protein product [Triticum turgidum subsp. durum]
MRTRVCARVGTPQGVGALLLDRRGKEDDVLDGGVVEKEQQKSDQSDENLGREVREVEADGFDGKEVEELQEIQEQVDEILADELDSKPTDNLDPNASQESAEIINANATEGVKNSDESFLPINSPEITHEEHIGHGHGGDQQTSSTQMTAHQSQISEQLKVDTMTETATVENVSKQKPPAQERVAPINSPACPSLPALFKPAEKKRPANTGWNETGMKLGQDGGSKKAAAKGVAVVTMDRRAASMAILAIIFAVTIGVNVVVRLYSTLRAA